MAAFNRRQTRRRLADRPRQFGGCGVKIARLDGFEFTYRKTGRDDIRECRQRRMDEAGRLVGTRGIVDSLRPGARHLPGRRKIVASTGLLLDHRPGHHRSDGHNSAPCFPAHHGRCFFATATSDAANQTLEQQKVLHMFVNGAAVQACPIAFEVTPAGRSTAEAPRQRLRDTFRPQWQAASAPIADRPSRSLGVSPIAPSRRW